MRNLRLLLTGAMLLVVSLTPLVLPDTYKGGLILTLFYLMFCIGIIMVSDFITVKEGGKFFLIQIVNRPKELFHFYVFMGAVAFVFDGLITYLAGLWWYPFYSTSTYIIAVYVIGGSAIYFMSILSSYFAMKIFIDKIHKGKKVVTKPYKFESWLFPLLFVVGLLCDFYVVQKILEGTDYFRNFIFIINTSKQAYISFPTLLISFFGIWFTSEWVIFRKGGTPMIRDLLHGYLTPILACYLAAGVLLLYMELQNLPIKLWVYSSQPLRGVTLFGLPLWVYLTWPIHYIALVSAYRAFGSPLSRNLLSGDTIK